MQRNIHEMLLAFDEKGQWEHPKIYDWRQLWADVRALKEDVERLAGQTFSFDENVQDASFLTLLASDKETSYRIGSSDYSISLVRIVFSNFGRMFTIYAANDEQIELVGKLVGFISERGFTHIPVAALEEPYDGVNPSDGRMTWQIRYFDYL